MSVHAPHLFTQIQWEGAPFAGGQVQPEDAAVVCVRIFFCVQRILITVSKVTAAQQGRVKGQHRFAGGQIVVQLFDAGGAAAQLIVMAAVVDVGFLIGKIFHIALLEIIPARFFHLLPGGSIIQPRVRQVDAAWHHQHVGACPILQPGGTGGIVMGAAGHIAQHGLLGGGVVGLQQQGVHAFLVIFIIQPCNLIIGVAGVPAPVAAAGVGDLAQVAHSKSDRLGSSFFGLRRSHLGGLGGRQCIRRGGGTAGQGQGGQQKAPHFTHRGLPPFPSSLCHPACAAAGSPRRTAKVQC